MKESKLLAFYLFMPPQKECFRGYTGISPVFPVKFQLGGFLYPLLPKNGGIKKKIGVQNRTSMDTKLLKSH